MIWILLVAILAPLLWYTCIRPMNYWKNLGVKQSKPWPLIGDSWTSVFKILSLAEFVDWMYNMHPNSRYSGYYHFTVPSLLLRDPELIKQITVKDFEHFTDHRPFVDPESDPLFGANLFTLKGQRWRGMRATLSGSFTSSKMKRMFHLMEEAAENFVQHFSDKNEDVVEVEMKDIYTRYANDVIATTAFGIKCDSLGVPNNEFYRMGRAATNFTGILTFIKFFGYLAAPKLSKLLKVTFLTKELSSFFKSIIYETIKVREENGIIRLDMINLLLETKNGVRPEDTEEVETGFATVKESAHNGKLKQNIKLTNDDIVSQALIFFFAAFETVSTALCFGSYELAINKDIQDRLRDEIKETSKKTDGKLTYDALLKMKYLDMVVSEILRKWPPVVAMDRVCTKPYTIQPVSPDEKPVSLKVGDILVLPFHGIHRDPAHYPDPDKFDPERFSDENKDMIKPYTYMPFGSGPRNCIGSRFALLEIKALLFNLLLNFEIVPIEKTNISFKFSKSLLQHSVEGGVWFGLKRIKK